jgi:hypothetical protein
MRKAFFTVLLSFGLAICSVWAGGTVDASMVSDADITKVDAIAQALDPELAIQTALTSFPQSSYPLMDYLKIQEMKINRIFNEYGVEFNQFADYKGLNSKAQVVFSRLKSRYSYLDSMEFKKSDDLRAALVLLKD